MTLGEKIKFKRQELQLTQQELAAEMHVSRQTISNWEVGRSYPDIESLIRLSELFAISLDELLKGDLKMVASLKKRSVWEILYYVYIGCLAVGSLICISVELLVSRQLGWSLIVVAGCLIAAAALTVLKAAKTYKLIKASLAVSALLVPLFLAIHSLYNTFNLTVLFSTVGIWLLYYWLLLLLWEFTPLGFWPLLALALISSIPAEGLTRLLTDGGFSSDFLLDNLIELACGILCLFVGLLKLDQGRLDAFFQAFRHGQTPASDAVSKYSMFK